MQAAREMSRARGATNFIVRVKCYSSKLLDQLKDDRDVVKVVGISKTGTPRLRLACALRQLHSLMDVSPWL